MRLWGWVWGSVLAGLFAAAPASAQLETPITTGIDSGWTATAGRTVGMGNGVVHAEAGWPGIGLTYLHGLDDDSDLGLHLGFNYGFEGTANSVVGFNLAAPYRRTIGRSGDTTIAFRADPGLSIYGNNGSALVGIGGPIGVVAGFRINQRLTFDLGADMPVMVSLANPVGLLFGPQVGAGAEYMLDRNLAVTVRARVGPEFALASSGSGSEIGFTTLIGVAYNTR